jgi:hypothetical protein
MVARSELMAGGLPWQVATALGNSAQSNLVAAGIDQPTGLPLLGSFCVFATTATGAQACVLPSANGRPMTAIFNNGAATLMVFPAVGESINGVANASLNIPVGKGAHLTAHINQWIGVIST